jgi:type IV fimbrial biogenesis protein FimT
MLVNRHRGFSVLELMIVIAIIGILTAVGFPSLQQMVIASRIKTTAADIHRSLLRARSEAIKQNTNITVTATNGSWMDGWTVSGDLESHDAITGSTVTVVGTANITFTPNGRATTTPITINLTSSQISLSRCVTVSLSGQPYVKDTACS